MIILLAGCDMSKTSSKNEISLNHSNGLTVNAAIVHNSIDKTAKGYTIKLSEPDSRQVNRITLEYKDTHSLKNAQQRAIGDQSYWSTLDVYSGGSGGDEHTLTIWKPLGNKGILLVHYIQTEVAPNFDDAWDIIESAIIVP